MPFPVSKKNQTKAKIRKRKIQFLAKWLVTGTEGSLQKHGIESHLLPDLCSGFSLSQQLGDLRELWDGFH